ncbi:MAG: fumarate/nitrate reduction transcriptional regulator Fnr [Moraxellaceae bacterium]|jgi:CRP/FNR family transcriptional regulator|nr:fumarate/nitrate reduction transcriptional regulator Fnr [Moraxellaceae bacterium]MBP7229086.1 fumarate/nitrate reduction transcriptional regulator Fnr [Moraxellaceae bacterium]MBP8852785.1 fumarate/nitrate reduction transcriptional regulator Fnr [Moraxellaceae bacterium]MBP9045006.1 fumarate/nitrate reduction transcriptional regulator Fnr [Moraxellaceae bacterium]MBP9730037.1 fumarate/nitrate reduction transcriptional regulator Fnr [Moraxellaceae bacterium]
MSDSPSHTTPIIVRTLRESNCADCALNPVCLPPAVEDIHLDKLDNIIERNRPLQRGNHLFHERQAFEAVYAVRSGAIKAYTTLPGGEEQVTGFYLPGEIVGLDAINNRQHASSAVALETTAVCTIPFGDLEQLSMEIPGLQHHLFKLMSQEIQSDQQLMVLLSKRTAEERIASLLLSLSARHKRRRLSDANFRLPMSRSDIGNYLGLAVETVSRIFTRFQQMGVLGVVGKEITILNRPQLCLLAEPASELNQASGT